MNTRTDAKLLANDLSTPVALFANGGIAPVRSDRYLEACKAGVTVLAIVKPD